MGGDAGALDRLYLKHPRSRNRRCRCGGHSDGFGANQGHRTAEPNGAEQRTDAAICGGGRVRHGCGHQHGK